MVDPCKYELIAPVAAGESHDLLAGKSQSDGVRRVQALLADWLRMENVVILTAGGCSVSLGGRVMAGPPQTNLECLVLEAVEKCALSDDSKSILDWRKANGVGDGRFESWLSFLFNAPDLVGDASPIDSLLWKATDLRENRQSHSAHGSELRRYIEQAIFAECALEIDRSELFGAQKSSGHFPFLAKLIARDTNLGRTHLFTLNYDTLFEQALEELGVQYFDGFVGKVESRFDPSVYGLDIYYPGDVAEGRVRRFDKFLQYYKLHGSIHWYQSTDGSFRARHRDLGFARAYRERNAEEKAATLETPEFKAISHFGILPTSQKFTQTLDWPYAHLFRLFHARLNQPQTFLMVLGYGFGDAHVNQIIETALMNPSLVMLVVEPNPKGTIIQRVKNYQSLGQRAFVLTERLADGQSCTYKLATFADFAQNVMPDVKWLDDYRRLRVFEEQIRKTQDHANGA